MADSDTIQQQNSFSRCYRLSVDREVAVNIQTRGEEKAELYVLLRRKIYSISSRQQHDAQQSLEEYLHDVWYTAIRAAIALHALGSPQDQIVAEVIRTRELGALAHGGHPITTIDGALWSDLPFLVDDLEEFWETRQENLPTRETLNFVSFVAKLVALGVRANELSELIMEILDDALGSTPAPNPNQGGEDGGLIPGPKFPRLLEPAVLILKLAGNRIGMLSKQGEVEGASLENWTLWHRMLQQTYQRSPQPAVRELARVGMNEMTGWSNQLGIPTEIQPVELQMHAQ